MASAPRRQSGHATDEKYRLIVDLIKVDTPHTPAKIQKMLNQLEFKLQVERQYQKGFDLMQRAYTADGDKKSRQDAQNQKLESDKTIQLLSSALRRYKNLHVIQVEEEENEAGGFTHSLL